MPQFPVESVLDLHFLNIRYSDGGQPMKSFLFALVTALLFASASATAGDVAAGKTKSAICAACHGATGKSMNPMWPNLAGQKELYLAKQIKAFRDGIRQDPLMAPMVAALSDDDIANLAAYFAAQEG